MSETTADFESSDYDLSPEEMLRFEARLLAKLTKERDEGRLRTYTGDIEALVGDGQQPAAAPEPTD